MKIDAHQHFWNYDPVEHAWIDDSMAAIQRDFRPNDLHPLLTENGFDGCIYVQVSQTEAETESMLRLADKHSFIKGVVGWLDLCAPNISDRLQYFSQFPALRGLRYILQDKEDAFMLRPDFQNGIAQLSRCGLTYDVLIFPRHLAAAEKLVRQFPNQKFVIDHLAKPDIKNREIKNWRAGIDAIARHQNVFCKVSGMVTEADWQKWQPSDLRPYLDVVFEAFGARRLMFGSDWPVCLVAASYRQVISAVRDYISNLSTDEQTDVLGLTAARFYNIRPTLLHTDT